MPPPPSQRKLKHALECLQTGDFVSAMRVCEQVLERAPRNAEAFWLLGSARLMSGDPRGAVQMLEHAIDGAPHNIAPRDSLGLALLMLGEFAKAEGVLHGASTMPGAPAVVHMRLGLALLHQAKFHEAIVALKHAVALDPDDTDSRLNLGQAYARAGDSAGAQALFRSIIADVPNHPDALYNLGVLSLERNDFDATYGWMQRTLACSPHHVDALTGLGLVLQKRGRLEEAEAALRKALVVQANSAPALSQLGALLARRGEGAQAHQHFVKALRVNPGQADAREGLAKLFMGSGRYREAITELRELVRIEPTSTSAYVSLAAALLQLGAVDEAEQEALRARELAPGTSGPYSVLAQIYLLRGALDEAAHVLQQGVAASSAPNLLAMLTHLLARTCDWPSWQPLWKKTATALDQGAIVGSPFFLLSEATTPQTQLAYARSWAAMRFGATVRTGTPSPRRNGRRLRIGYLSSDFQRHAVGYLIVEALERHDRGNFEVFAYSYGPDDQSDIRSRLAGAVEHFVDIAWEPDDRVIERMRRDELDVLVDLKGYTLGDRLAIMAHRPCAIQVTWLGYPGTTGAPFIDYLIADPFLIAPEEEDAYSEKILRLPHCYQPNDSRRTVAATLARCAYGLREGDFVFCCFNQASKIKPEIFARWMALLQRVPRSVLWLLEDNRWAKANLTAAAEAEGIAGARLVFAPRAPQAEHLARYRAADLALDTFPYTSHTTASDSLWVGCPLVALCGNTFASRVSSSILTSSGLADLVTHTLDQYEDLAYRLATEPGFLSAVRIKVALARNTAPLFNSAALAQDLEQLYLKISA